MDTTTAQQKFDILKGLIKCIFGNYEQFYSACAESATSSSGSDAGTTASSFSSLISEKKLLESEWSKWAIKLQQQVEWMQQAINNAGGGTSAGRAAAVQLLSEIVTLRANEAQSDAGARRSKYSDISTTIKDAIFVKSGTEKHYVKNGYFIGSIPQEGAFADPQLKYVRTVHVPGSGGSKTTNSIFTQYLMMSANGRSEPVTALGVSNFQEISRLHLRISGVQRAWEVELVSDSTLVVTKFNNKPLTSQKKQKITKGAEITIEFEGEVLTKLIFTGDNLPSR